MGLPHPVGSLKTELAPQCALFGHDLVIFSTNKANGVESFSFVLPAPSPTLLSAVVKEEKACIYIMIVGPQHNGVK